MKTISVVTSTRAEFGLLLPLIRRVVAHPEWQLKLAVTGAHLNKAYGETITEVEGSGIPIDIKIDIFENGADQTDISGVLGQAVTKFGAYFHRLHPDLLIVLGDRYEILGVVVAAMTQNVPIAHIHGGETTEGAMDEAIRHAISKMSHLHFTSCEAYRKRVIQLGESPDRVFNVGALGVENIKTLLLLPRDVLSKAIGFDLDGPYLLVTFHPVTLEPHLLKKQLRALFAALDCFPALRIVFTKANADSGGLEINEQIDRYVNDHADRTIAFTSMGYLRYLSAMRDCAAVVGNSSSGILEAPSFGVPTVNIGDRQKGRIQAKSIINCEAEAKAIADAINQAMSADFRAHIVDVESPYGQGDASSQITAVLQRILDKKKINIKKNFYDIQF